MDRMRHDIETQLEAARKEIGPYRLTTSPEKESRFEYAFALFRHTGYPPGSFIGVFHLVLTCFEEAGLELRIKQ